MKNEESLQASFFNKSKNQHPLKLIIKPPLHLKDELSKIFSILEDKKIKDIVDFGSGTGRLTIPLLKKDFFVTAIDVSKNSLQKVRNLAKKLKVDKKLKTLQYINTLKQAKLIIGSDILHHIDIKKYLPILHRKLTTKGKILFSEPNPLNLPWLIYITFFADWRAEYRIFTCNYFNLKKQLTRAGFKKIKIDGFGLLPTPLLNHLSFFRKINFFLGNLPVLKFFSYRLIIGANK